MRDDNLTLRLKAVLPEAEDADHIDVKSVTGRGSLRVFLARMLSYKPGWYRALFRLRGVLARILGLWHEDIDSYGAITPESVSFTPGETALFFTVKRAEEERYWAADGGDSHLDAALVVFFDNLSDGRRRFHVATVVTYKSAAGPLYFNIIRPFHHLVVAAMARHAAGGAPAPLRRGR
jgi:hypothetical protein